MGLQKSPANAKRKPDASPNPPCLLKSSWQKVSGSSFSRTFTTYFPRASAQVQPRPSDVAELLRHVEALRERESRLKMDLLEQKLLNEAAAIVPVPESEIESKDSEIERLRKKIDCLEAENERLRQQNEFLHAEKIGHVQDEPSNFKRAVAVEPSSKLVDVANSNDLKSGLPKVFEKMRDWKKMFNISEYNWVLDIFSTF